MKFRIHFTDDRGNDRVVEVEATNPNAAHYQVARLYMVAHVRKIKVVREKIEA